MSMKNEELERKLKREAVEVCLNCERFVGCDKIGLVDVDHCESFAEVNDTEQVVIIRLDEYAKLKN